MATVIAAVPAVDATLEGTARSTLGKMTHELGTLQQKVVQAAKRRDDTLRRQFERTRALAFPGGEPQERAIGLVWLLNRVGPALLGDPRPRAAGRPRAGRSRRSTGCSRSSRCRPDSSAGSSRPTSGGGVVEPKDRMSRASRLEVASAAFDRRAPSVKARRKRRWLRYLVAAFAGPAAPHRLGAVLLLRHPVAGDRDAAARRSRTVVAADLRPSARAAGRPVADRGRADRAAQRSRLRRPAAGHRGRTVRRRRERHRAVDPRRQAGRHGGPGRVRSGRGQAGHAGDRDDPPHRARRRRHLASAASRSSRRSSPRSSPPAARSGARCRWRRFPSTCARRCSPSRTAASTTIPAST